MTNKVLYCTLFLCLTVVLTTKTQAQEQRTTKKEQRFHDKENTRFVNDVESLQEQIQTIRADKSLSKAEQKAKIKPIYDRMTELRAQNVNARNYDDGSSTAAMPAKGRKKDMADTDGKRMSKKDRKTKARLNKQETKRLKKEIKRVKKDKALTEGERVAKLEMLNKELNGIQSGKGKAKDMASTKKPMRKKDMATKSAETRARDQWKSDRDAERKAKKDSALAKQKKSREVARAKREKNIKEWKARARKESGAVQSTTTMTTKTKSSMTQTANVNAPDQMAMPNQPVTQKKSRLTSQQRTMARLTRMSSNLTALKDKGLINLKHYEQKMAHIRSFREKMMKP